jgi:hypothetical protein
MIRRPWTLLACCLTLAVPLGWSAVGCSGSKTGGGVPLPSLSGVVRTYADAPNAGVPVSLGGAAATTRADGLILLGGVSTGSQVLRVGDSVTTPTLLVPLSGSGGAQHLERPVHLPDLESGLVATLPAAISAVTTISGDQLPGVSLRLDPGTAVSFPSAGAEVSVLGISPSRIPATLPSGLAPRVAFMVEPHRVQFTPAATLTVPRLDSASSGPFDVYRVSTSSGRWELTQSDVLPTNGAFELQVNEGTLYTVVPRAAPPTVTVTGRIVAGTQPVAGYRASCWNLVSDPTGSDGVFEIHDVPTSYGAYLVRAFPEQAGAQFAVEVEARASLSPNLGDVVVAARPADHIRPRVVRTSPSDGQLNVDHRAQVVVTFSEPILPGGAAPFRLVGSRGTVAGRISFDNAFTVRLVPAQPLRRGEDHTIVIEQTVEDLTGNRVDDAALAFRFRTKPGAQDPAPTDTKAYGLAPLSGAKGETIAVPGRNFTGGTTVTVGGTQALVVGETTDEIQFRVPDFQPAGDVTVSLSAGGNAVDSLRPLVLDVRASVAAVLSGTSPDELLAVLDRAQPPAAFVVDGSNVGGATVTVDGVSVAAVDSTVTVASQSVATGRTVSLSTPAAATLFTGPVVVRGSNGQPGASYRFLQVRE